MKLWLKKGWVLAAAAVALCCAAFAVYVCIDRSTTDRKAPVITFQTEELRLSVNDGEASLLEGVTAWDERDGDVTAGLVVEGVSSISADQRATVTYAAFDGAGNVTKARRTVWYADYESPRFTLSQPLVFRSGRTFDVLDCVGAQDAIDGVLDDKIKATLVSGEGSLSEAGLHLVEFRVTNSMGETIYLTAPVEVYESGLYNAVLELTQPLVYVERNARFAEESYLKSMTAGTRVIPLDALGEDVSVEIESDVDTRTPGTYSVGYTVKSGAYTGHTRLVVVVEE